MAEKPGSAELAKSHTHDVFICHASEDKESIAKPLYERLVAAGLSVWYDEFSLKLGDSLRGSIDRGLADSRFGVVIFSPSFFNKNWPQAELNGMFAKEMNGGKMILPIWHNLEQQDIVKVSPLLADRVAAKTSNGMDNVVERVLDVIEPEMAHKTREGETIAVSPKLFMLHSGAWAKTTSLILRNLSDSPLHSVWLKISACPSNIPTQSIKATSSKRTVEITGQAAGVEAYGDVIRIDAETNDGTPAVYLLVHTLLPHENREIIVSSLTPVESFAQASVLSFGHTPAQVAHREGQAAFPFTPPEGMKVKSISILMRRISDKPLKPQQLSRKKSKK